MNLILNVIKENYRKLYQYCSIEHHFVLNIFHFVKSVFIYISIQRDSTSYR